MAITWTPPQRQSVERAFVKHPAASGRCVQAADGVFKIASERDPRIWQLWPAEGDYVLPRATVGELWYYHLTVEVEAHCVDALTGPDGTPRAGYPEEHWKEHDAIDWIPDDGRRPPCRPASSG